MKKTNEQTKKRTKEQTIMLDSLSKRQSEILKSGVSQKSYDQLVKRIIKGNSSQEFINGALSIIQNIDYTIENEVMPILNLLPQDKWDFYEMIGFTGSEMKLLMQARRYVKNLWKQIPQYRKEAKVNESTGKD